MVKIIKKKKKFRIEGIISLVFIMSIFAYFVSVTLLRSHNVILASTERDLDAEIEVLSNDVENLELAVKKLENRDRILQFAQEHGLTINQEKIVSVKND